AAATELMALTQRLQIRQSQALVMTPQLMQAIKLLQLSNLDLIAYVETELERNPLLDSTAEGEAAPAAADAAPSSDERPGDGEAWDASGTEANGGAKDEKRDNRLDDTSVDDSEPIR